MINCEKFYFYENNADVRLEVYTAIEYPEYCINRRPMMLICPGGGYSHLSPREAEPIARAYMAQGYNAAILYYSVTGGANIKLYDEKLGVSKPHFEVAKSICILRDNAYKFNINPEQITVIGFSAGGHLAGCASIMWNDEYLVKALGCPVGYNKPNAAILAYPVITSGTKAHRGSFDSLLGKNASPELLRRYSLEYQVKEKNPPTFIFHTATDAGVPVHNSYLIATALADAKCDIEMHIFPTGNHGMSLANSEVLQTKIPLNTRWLKWSVTWLETIYNL